MASTCVCTQGWGRLNNETIAFTNSSLWNKGVPPHLILKLDTSVSPCMSLVSVSVSDLLAAATCNLCVSIYPQGRTERLKAALSAGPGRCACAAGGPGSRLCAPSPPPYFLQWLQLRRLASLFKQRS